MGAMASQITGLTTAYSTVYQAQIKENIKNVTGLCAGNSSVIGEFAQMASNAENVSIWWRHHELGVAFGGGIKTYPVHWQAKGEYKTTETYILSFHEPGF